MTISKDRITLRGEDANTTTIHGKWIAEKVVNVTGNYVNVSGFTVAGSPYERGFGIYVDGDNCIISNNNIVEGVHGIYLNDSDNSAVSHNNASALEHGCGIDLFWSEDCLISYNIVNFNIGGIHLSYSNNCNITNNIANSNDYIGILLVISSDCKLINNIANSNTDFGIWLGESGNCKLENNIASNNDYGIYMFASSNCTLKNNAANSNNDYGICLDAYSNNCKLENNFANSNDDHGIYLGVLSNCELENNIANLNNYGIRLYSSSNCKLENNFADSNNENGIKLEYLNNCKLENNIANSNRNTGIALEDSNNCSITNNIANSNSNNGIFLYSSSNCSITKNIADSNMYGIHLEPTNTNNTITENNISNNDYGMHLDYSPNNEVYHNNFINNNKQAYDHHGFNKWDKGPLVGGNYWSDHVCTGNPSNGSQPYTKIDTDAGAVDNYPFEDPDGWVIITPTISISTDKYEYTAGETMLINITLSNPTEEWQPVYFTWRLDLPDYDLNYWIMKKALYLPPDYEQKFAIPFTLGDYGIPFNASWYVALYNTTALELISEDTADWRYMPGKMAKGETIPPEIGKEIMKKVEEVKILS